MRVLFLAFLLTGCTHTHVDPVTTESVTPEPVYPQTDWPDDMHNDRGGYIPACGDLPPLLGDDC